MIKSPPRAALFRKADDFELRLCQLGILWARERRLEGYFRIVSRLGDGLFWGVLLLVLTILEGVQTGAFCLLVTLICSLVYKTLKALLVRERPFITHPAITCSTRALDRYSFPSGHTLHAVAINILIAYFNPVLASIIAPFTISVALSRIVLGLHYPSDVGAGAVIGFVLASTSLSLLP